MRHDRLETCIHEVGHSICRLVIYGSPGRIAVFTEPAGNAAGVSCGASDDPEEAARAVLDTEVDCSHLAGDLRACLDQAALSLAGAAAVALWRNHAHLLPDCGGGSRRDVQHACECARLAFSETDGLLIDSFIRLAYRHACAVLSRRMDAVLGIAEKLAEKGELSETEIGALYADAITEKKETEVHE